MKELPAEQSIHTNYANLFKGIVLIFKMILKDKQDSMLLYQSNDTVMRSESLDRSVTRTRGQNKCFSIYS